MTVILVSGMKVNVLVAQLCPTLCDPIDCSPPDSSVRGMLHARILNWVAISFSREEEIPHPFLGWAIQGLKQGPLHCRQIIF